MTTSYLFFSIVLARIIIEPEDVVGIAGENVIFSCRARGFPAPDILWLKGGKEVNISSEVTMTTYNVSLLEREGYLSIDYLSQSDRGYYSCLATNRLVSTEITISGNVTLMIYCKFSHYVHACMYVLKSHNYGYVCCKNCSNNLTVKAAVTLSFTDSASANIGEMWVLEMCRFTYALFLN